MFILNFSFLIFHFSKPHFYLIFTSFSKQNNLSSNGYHAQQNLITSYPICLLLIR